MPKPSIAIAVVLAACTTFDPLERNICGNGIVEAGEDCDSSAATCVACAVTCSAAADCPNGAYACGVDGLCHAPSGVLAPATPPSLFLVDDIRITDIDHDGIGDVLGASKTSLAVRFGDKQGALTGAFTTETPPQTGPTAFTDLDGDGTDDAVLVSPDGIVAYASPFGVPTPATSFLPLQVNAQDLPIRATFPLAGVAVGAIVTDPDTHVLFTLIVEFTSGGVTAQPFPMCSMPDGDFTPDALDVYQANFASDGQLDVVVSAWTKGTSGRHMCMTSIHLDAPAGNMSRAAHFADITPSGGVPTRKPIWANLDTGGSVCPWLINSDGGGAALKAWVGSMGAGHCVIAGATTNLPAAANAGAGSSAVGHIPFKPGFLFLGADVLVLSSSVYVYSSIGPSFTEVYQSERVLSKVVSGDLDGDGAIDGVLVGNDDDDLEIVYRAGGGVVPGYIVLRYDTAGVVSDVRIDDYDGNGIGDVAFVENLLGHQSLSVAYSNPGHAFTTVTTASFASMKSMIPLQAQDSSDPYGAIGDLLVLEDLGSNQPALTLLHGTPQRAMLSFFDPRGDGDNNRSVVMRQVVGGDFATSTGTTQYSDVLAFLPSSVATGVQVYRLDGTAAGLDPSDPLNAVGGASNVGGAHLTGIEDCTVGIDTGTPCIRNAHLTAWSTAAQHDIVIGIDRQPTPHAFSLDPWAFASNSTVAVTTVDTLVAAVPQGAYVHSTRALDLDGDGANELVVTFQPAEVASATGAGLVELCTMNASGMPTTCTDLLATVQAAAPKIVSCVDAAVGHFTHADALTPPTAGAELVVLCHDAGGEAALARITANADTHAYEATVIASKLGPLRSIEIGDIDGNGVDDVIAIRGDAGSRSLTVLAQCESRDVTCQATGVTP